MKASTFQANECPADGKGSTVFVKAGVDTLTLDLEFHCSCDCPESVSVCIYVIVVD